MAKPRLVMGDEIAGYRLGEILGIGGLGTVYATARDGRDLAIKLIAHGGDHGLQVRATREVQALRRLDHPNVLGLVDAGADDTWSYLVMPRIAGVSLRELVAGGPLTPESAALLVMHAARGVGAIHRAGLCHRDLKPDNIMITDDGRVVIIDLGLALAPDWTRQTTEGAIAGSLPYMAPEQIEGDAGAASDVWALGVTWWELLTGTRPFARGRPVEEIAAIAAGSRVAIGEVDRRLDDAAAQLIERCLHRDVAARPPHGEALAAAIERLGSIDDAALVALRVDRRGWESGVAARVAGECARVADELASAGDVFAAMRAIDRGLAYRPGEPTLESMLLRIMPPNTAGAVGTPRRPRPITAEAIAATQLAIVTKRRRWPWLAGAAALIAGTATIAVLASRGEPARPDPTDGFTDPRAVLEVVIDVAKTGDARRLSALCSGESQPSAQRLCDARPGTPAWQRLRELFGDASVEGHYRTADGATVMLRLGARRASVELLRRHGRYYLGSL